MRILTLVMLGLLLGRAPLLAADQSAPAQLQRTYRQLDRNGDGQLEAQEVGSEHARLFARLLRTSDADGNGSLSQNEFQQGLQPQRQAKPLAVKQSSRLPGSDELLLLVAMADANADGVIKPDEVPERLLPFYDRLEQRLGGGGQQQIRVQEIAKAAPALTRFAQVTVERMNLDVDLEYGLLPDKNWALVERLEAPRRPGDALADPEQAMERFRNFDANGDGQIVYEEVPEQYAARFDRLLARADRNRDQQISQQELQDLSRRLRNLRKNRRTPNRVKRDQQPEAAQDTPAMAE